MRRDELRLLNTAQSLRSRQQRGTDQGLRKHALLAVLLGSGLRVSEARGLRRGQYTGTGVRQGPEQGWTYPRQRARATRRARGAG